MARYLDRVVQGSCGCSLPGSAQGQAGWEFEQPDVVQLMSLPMAGFRIKASPNPNHLEGLFQPKPFGESTACLVTEARSCQRYALC